MENTFHSIAFTFSEFNLALSEQNYSLSPGMDRIVYFTLQQLPIEYKLILLDIINEIYALSDYPESWKNSYVHLIEKSDGESVRPIYLLSYIC